MVIILSIAGNDSIAGKRNAGTTNTIEEVKERSG